MDIIKTTEWSCNMKYCTKCKRLYTDTNESHCTLCGKALIDDPNHYSPVYVVTANGFEILDHRSEDEWHCFTCKIKE